MNPPHRFVVGCEQQDGAVVDDDLHVALVVLDEEMVVLDRVARVRVAVAAATRMMALTGRVNAASE